MKLVLYLWLRFVLKVISCAKQVSLYTVFDHRTVDSLVRGEFAEKIHLLI